ncbi:MAG: hypothetical protein FWD69_08105 [Polyangiaceae bacterium]|nr:hypothetical protein [Polyangiaceae bacterium]
MFHTARSLFRRVDPALYVLWAAAWTLTSARSFYGYMLKQTGGEWSAPLDDVFIHFDYARATALGHPFEWTVGNGYSSGNTSLTYPFVLAVGWRAGFRDCSLMIWAAIVAATCVFGFLLAVRGLFLESDRDDWGHVSSYLLPPMFLGVGAFVWSLWSGMEVAFFMATWAIALLAWQRLERVDGNHRAHASAWWLGLAGVLLVTTRPEAALTVAVFGVAAALAHARFGLARAMGVLVRAGLPGALALAVQSVTNKVFTGEWSANGALVKLALNNPYLSEKEKVEDYIFNVKYAALRNLDYHFASARGEHMADFGPADGSNVFAHVWTSLSREAWWAGVVPLVLAMLPLAFARTRRVAIVLWAELVLWIGVVAFNGQVRWQNERYVMPAVGIMLVLAALGVSVALRTRAERHGCGARTKLWAVRAALVVLSLVFAYDHQIPKMRDQKWFFGRASRNIRDQHLALGKYLAETKPRRVLVGDAGAILYASDRPGLDLIGLGGYGKLPFARASVHGLGASLELIERMPESERPDLLAIFPTWWGVLQTWFSSDLVARFPVEGNVICGGYEQNVYRADWHLLGTGDRLRTMPRGDTEIRAVIDVGDLVSEKENGYAFDRPANGFVDMHILPDPANPALDMFDGGRRINVGMSESFLAKGLLPSKAAHLVVRTAPERDTRVRVQISGAYAGDLDLARTGGWVEAILAIPADRVTESMHIQLVNDGPGDFVDFHAWLTQ